MIVAVLDVFQHIVAQLHELHGLGDAHVLGAAHHDGLEVLVAHHRADAAPAGAGAALLNGGEKHPVFPGHADGRHLGLGLLELLADKLRGLDGPLAP